MKTRVLVLGSNSFSGSDLIDHLLESSRYTVLAVSRSPEKSALFLPYKRFRTKDLRFQRADLNHDLKRILRLSAAFKPEYIVNFAAQSEVAPSWEHPAHWFDTNVTALAGLCDGLRRIRSIKRYVHISSPEVYGACRGIDERAPMDPSTPYAASKAAADLLLSVYRKQFSFPVVTVRSTNVYGAHQQLFKIIPRSVIYLKRGKVIELHGGGRAVKSYIHIRDVSRATRLVMEQGRIGEIYHISLQKGIAVRDVVQRICALMGKDLSGSVREVGERTGQDSVYEIDSTKIRRELGWAPSISLEAGLKGVIDWVNAGWPQIRRLPLEYRHKA